MLVSGGGVRNDAILQGLGAELPTLSVESTATVGLDPAAKEAVAFAVLAHETASGVRTGMPGVTGASRSVVQGKICLP